MEKLKNFNTTTLIDSLYKVNSTDDVDGIHGGYLPDLYCINGSKLIGHIHPVEFKYRNSNERFEKLNEHFVDSCPLNSVLLLLPPLDSTNACFGGLLGTAAKAQGVAGVVSSGNVRDVDELVKTNLTVFAKGTSVCGQSPFLVPVKSNGAIKIYHANGHSFTIKPNDILVADEHGVIILPHSKIDQLLSISEHSQDCDEKCRSSLEKGESVKETFLKFRGK